MKISIAINNSAHQKQFNYHIKKLYDIQSIIHKQNEVDIVGNITNEQKLEIENYYNSLDGSFHLDAEYMQYFLKDKLILTAESGKDYIFEITARIHGLISSQLITIEQGENYLKGIDEVENELSKGYFHSAYFLHITYIPENQLLSLHEEIRIFIKNYVNTVYPPNFNIID
jgi:hypothetical protein